MSMSFEDPERMFVVATAMKSSAENFRVREEVERVPREILAEKSRIESMLHGHFGDKMRKLVLAAVLSFSSMALERPLIAGEHHRESDVSAEVSDQENDLPRKNEVATAEAEKLAAELDATVKTKIKNLGLFAKRGFVNQIKENADGIRKLVFNNDRTVLKQAKDTLKEVMEYYMSALPAIKNKDETVFQKTIHELMALVATIENSSLGELKNDPRFKNQS